jgi:hypothetical protein
VRALAFRGIVILQSLYTRIPATCGSYASGASDWGPIALRSGVMNYLIGRDQEREVMLSLAMLEAVMEGRPHHDRDTPHVRIISRFTCG